MVFSVQALERHGRPSMNRTASGVIVFTSQTIAGLIALRIKKKKNNKKRN